QDTAARIAFVVKSKDKGPDIAGQLVDPPGDGQRLLVEVSAKNKGDEAGRLAVKITDQTHITYNGVGPDGAKPTAGYHAQVWLADGSKDTAAEVRLDAPGADSGKKGDKKDGGPAKPADDKKPEKKPDEKPADPKKGEKPADDKPVKKGEPATDPKPGDVKKG